MKKSYVCIDSITTDGRRFEPGQPVTLDADVGDPLVESGILMVASKPEPASAKGASDQGTGGGSAGGATDQGTGGSDTGGSSAQGTGGTDAGGGSGQEADKVAKKTADKKGGSK